VVQAVDHELLQLLLLRIIKHQESLLKSPQLVDPFFNLHFYVDSIQAVEVSLDPLWQDLSELRSHQPKLVEWL